MLPLLVVARDTSAARTSNRFVAVPKTGATTLTNDPIKSSAPLPWSVSLTAPTATNVIAPLPALSDRAPSIPVSYEFRPESHEIYLSPLSLSTS